MCGDSFEPETINDPEFGVTPSVNSYDYCSPCLTLEQNIDEEIAAIAKAEADEIMEELYDG